jgi:mycothiol conjugate amidase Mca
MSSERLTMMAVHAHPDDEVIVTGGMFARAAAAGARTVLVCCTGGEEGEIHDPELDPEEAKHRLAEIRAAELGRACEILHIEDLHFLGYRDSGMAGTDANADPRNFHNADPEDAIRRLVRLIRQHRPQVVITYDENGGYGHPDHLAAHQRTVAAVPAAADPARFPDAGEPWDTPKLYYAVWSMRGWVELRSRLRERGLPVPFEDEGSDFDPEEHMTVDERISAWVDVSAHLAQKKSALYAHRTQISQDFFIRTLPEDLADEMMSTECFQLARSTQEFPRPESDVFDGLR